ncbi:hypothetical protein BUALT_Bualt19G0065900 [Buddleja alternifolia]|uniref:Uncharacterized protein n=1 Tax=Buddleja alternifolia TaxID=168488 RepID=A0AAV6W7M9_9LAMI|nr:hypothetical protein BUALT_Bualt19G0065900 [Buddleja alternifolia]
MVSRLIRIRIRQRGRVHIKSSISLSDRSYLLFHLPYRSTVHVTSYPLDLIRRSTSPRDPRNCQTFNAHFVHKYLHTLQVITQLTHSESNSPDLLYTARAHMGLLDKLWDDTVAGPPPDSGLGKLRKHATFSFGSNSAGKGIYIYIYMQLLLYLSIAPILDLLQFGWNLILISMFSVLFCGVEAEVGNSRRSMGEEAAEEATRVTRSIMIVKPPQTLSKDSPPVSPAGSTPPVSPFAGAGGREAFRFRRRSASFAYEKANGVGPRSPPPPYDL